MPLYVTAQNPMLHKEELVMRGWLRPLQSGIANLLTPLISWSLQQADVVAAVSQYSANLARKMGARDVVVIPNGVDVKSFEVRQKQAALKTKFTILTISSLIPRNGLDTLIQAVALLSPELEWQLLLAGDGPEFNRLKLITNNLKLTKKVSFLGRVDNQEIPTLLTSADVFVRPSRQEGFGVAFLEAMAAGIPVIGTPVGGIPDFLTDSETGLLVPVDDPQALAGAIVSLKNNPKLKNILTTSALQLIKRRYDWDIVAQQVEGIMLSLKPKA